MNNNTSEMIKNFNKVFLISELQTPDIVYQSFLIRSIKSGLDVIREKGSKVCIPNICTILVDTIYSLYYVNNYKRVVQISILLSPKKKHFKSIIGENIPKKNTESEIQSWSVDRSVSYIPRTFSNFKHVMNKVFGIRIV